MNAASISSNNLIADNAGDSDSDTNSDEGADYYQPISSIDDNEDGDANIPIINGYHYQSDVLNQHNSLSNGHDYSAAAENGVRSLNLSEDEERESDEEEEERRRAELESAMRRAFQEDESRRNAPLPEDSAVRVMDAMRSVSFSGLPPDWVRDVPEDRWVQQLQQLRQPPHSTA